MNKILITAYEHPDLDGTACAIAYAELLQSQGQDATAALAGIPHREAHYVFQTFQITPPPSIDTLITKDTKIILVDASGTRGISSHNNLENVIEVIDHRKINEVEKFPNAKIQIELVGSAATLIAEKFMATNTPITNTSAALLYSAIVSNTINFQANVTTDRDKVAAKWLQNQFKEPPNYISEMFTFKSRFTESLRDTIVHDFADFSFNGHTIGIAQLEIVEVEKFITDNREELESILNDIKDTHKFEYIFLTAIDVLKATNTFLVIDEHTKQLLIKAVDISFTNNLSTRSGIMMRKTITPKIKEELDR